VADFSTGVMGIFAPALTNADVTQKSKMKQQTAGEPKGIFVCCDGTGNEFAARNSLDRNSNVVKLHAD
jgi:uncharacterized protein (DUF2235 family)